MKFKKIISAVSAFAMAMSLVTVANAASLGGKPVVTYEFEGYEKVTDTVAFAYVKVTLDMTAAEDLAAYEIVEDEVTYEEVEVGNGIKTMGLNWTIPTGFSYNKSRTTISTDSAGHSVSVNQYGFTYGPKQNATDYYDAETITVRLALKTNLDSKGTFLTDDATPATVAGKDTATGQLWDYAAANGTMTVPTGCEIPSYNEWSTPAGPTTETITATQEPYAAVKPGDVLNEKSAQAVAYWAQSTFETGQTAYWTATINSAPKKKEISLANVSGTAKLGIVITGATSVENVMLNVVTPAAN